MSRVYLHSNNNEYSLIKLMILLFIPFMLFGFYKNGIYLYNKEFINIIDLFRPLFYIGISLLTTFIFKLIFKEDFLSFRLLTNLMISLVVSPILNIFIYTGLLVFLNIVLKFIKINIVPIFMIINIGIGYLSSKNIFLNSLESSLTHSYSALDYFLGKGCGGVSNTLLIGSLISIFILTMNINYKKQIPIMSFAVYYILMIFYTFITSSASVDLLLNNNVIFSFIFVSNIPIYTPYSKGACYIYGFLLGLLTFTFSFIDINLAVYLSIIILGFIYKLIDKFIVGKSNNNLIEVL